MPSLYFRHSGIPGFRLLGQPSTEAFLSHGINKTKIVSYRSKFRNIILEYLITWNLRDTFITWFWGSYISLHLNLAIFRKVCILNYFNFALSISQVVYIGFKNRIKKCGSTLITIGFVIQSKNGRIWPFFNNGGNSFRLH